MILGWENNNGTPGGDQRVVGGQIIRASLPLHRADAGCSGSTNLTTYPAPPQAHHKIQSSPATATTMRRLATKHVPRVSPYSLAAWGPGFVEIGLVQLSQSVKMAIMTQKHTDRQTDTLRSGTLH